MGQLRRGTHLKTWAQLSRVGQSARLRTRPQSPGAVLLPGRLVPLRSFQQYNRSELEPPVDAQQNAMANEFCPLEVGRWPFANIDRARTGMKGENLVAEFH